MKKIWGILLIICILSMGCTSKKEVNGFFAWMDGYLAMGVGEEFNIALTFFFEKDKAPFNKNEVENLSFNTLEQIEITDYLITSLDTDKSLEYQGYIFDLTVRANKAGIFRTDKLGKR